MRAGRRTAAEDGVASLVLDVSGLGAEERGQGSSGWNPCGPWFGT
jgi:hypothetical protein